MLKQKYDEYNRLDADHRNLGQELQISKRRAKELEMMFNQKMEVEVSNKYKQYEMTIRNLSQERDELNRKLVDLSNRLN